MKLVVPIETIRLEKRFEDGEHVIRCSSTVLFRVVCVAIGLDEPFDLVSIHCEEFIGVFGGPHAEGSYMLQVVLSSAYAFTASCEMFQENMH